MPKLCNGLGLKTISKGIVMVRKVTKDEIAFEYNNKLYKRPKSTIGQKFFFIEKNEQNVDFTGDRLKCNYQKYTCRDCMYFKSEDCFGETGICNKFKKSPKIDKELIKNWSKYGTATHFRMIYRRKRFNCY